jgi:4-hydroxy-tetrahydrodipicolinate synthase
VAQRLAVMEAIAGSGLPHERFMVGTGASALADAVTLTRAAADLGFAGALVIPPFYYKGVSEDGLFAHFAALLERVDRPALRLYLYHFPALSGVPFTPAVIARLVDAFPGTITGLKDSSGDMAYADAIVDAFPELAVFPSTEAILLEARSRGFAGCISATVNVTAPLAGAVWSAVGNGATAADAAVDQNALTAMRATIARRPLVPAIRHTAARLYADNAFDRMLPPLAPLDAAEARALDDELDAQPAFRALTLITEGEA